MALYHNRNEKRTSRRFSYPKTITYKALGTAARPPGKISVQAKAVDLSSGGMKIQMKKKQLAEGSIIQIKMPVGRLKISIPVLTEVKWITEKSPNVYHIGLQFLLH